VQPPQFERQLPKVVSVRAGRQFSGSEKSIGGLSPQGRWRHVRWHFHEFVPLVNETKLIERLGLRLFAT
jgi:hypothetical protein